METDSVEDLHNIMLGAAFRNLLASPNQLQVTSGEGTRLCFNQHLFLLFSPLLRSLLPTLPPLMQGEPLTIFLPDTRADNLVKLAEILARGSTSTTTGEKESREVLEAAATLGIVMSSLYDTTPEKEMKIVVPPATTKEKVTEPVETTEKPADKTPIVKNQLVDKIMQNLSSAAKPVNETPPVIKKELVTEETVPTNEKPKIGDNPSPTDSTTEEATASESSTESMPKEFQCQKCKKAFDNLMHLRSHYCLHFKMILKKKFSNLSPDNRCMECSKQPVFASADRLLLHIGVHHRKIDDILQFKGITLPSNPVDLSKPNKEEVPSSPPKQTPFTPTTPSPPAPLTTNINPTPNIPAPSPEPTTDRPTPSSPEPSSVPSTPLVDNQTTQGVESKVNNELKCEVCGQAQKTIFALEQHCCRHFLKELRDQCSTLMEGGKCKICGHVFKQQQSLLLHLGCKHGKINEVLTQKGYGALPCPVTATNSAAMQRQLIKIKQERVESLVEEAETLLMDTSDTNLPPNPTTSKRVSFSLPNGIMVEPCVSEEHITESEISGKQSETNSKKSELQTKKSEMISKITEMSMKKMETPRKGSEINMKKSETPRIDLSTKGSETSRPATLDEILRKYQFTTGGTTS